MTAIPQLKKGKNGRKKTHANDRLDGFDIRLPADDRDLVLLDFDHALHDQSLKERRVLLALGHGGDLVRRLREQLLQQVVSRGHLLHARIPDHCRSRAAGDRRPGPFVLCGRRKRTHARTYVRVRAAVL